jgi:hypothetical protein
MEEKVLPENKKDLKELLKLEIQEKNFLTSR